MSTQDNIFSDFWLDEDYSEHQDYSMYDLRLIKMNEARKVISNFVNILTNKNINVKFKSEDTTENYIDDDTVYISSKLTKKKDFDYVVGLALHEGGHILLSDMEIPKKIWQKVPREVFDEAERLNLDKTMVCDLVFDVYNIIEDKYIDDFVYSTAVGYRGYYASIYDKYFYSEQIDAMLKSQMYREPSFDAYLARLINIVNKNSDLNALPDFKKMVEMIDLKTISRLKTSQQRLDLASDIVKMIVKNVAECYEEKKPQQNSKEQSPLDKKLTLDGYKYEVSDDKKPMNNVGDTSSLMSTDVLEMLDLIKKQKEFLKGNAEKRMVTNRQSKLLDNIDKSGIKVVSVGKNLISDKEGFKGVDCILVEHMTRELVEDSSFPLAAEDTIKKHIFDSLLSHNTNRIVSENDAVIKKGILMGRILGKKLQLRNETNVSRYIRKSSGRIDKRLLYEIGVGNSDIFYQTKIDTYDRISLHISVDASSSMSGKKWKESIALTVAICKAASMCNNIDTSVSFRTTVDMPLSLTYCFPYIVIAYDSRKDKFSKIETMFGRLTPGGCTPEGLAFESLMNHLDTMKLNAEKYFINISDGEPYFKYASFSDETVVYYNKVAINHTGEQVNKIKNKGYGILSYFIKDDKEDADRDSSSAFREMYGADASFVSVDNVSLITNTINNMFLKKTC